MKVFSDLNFTKVYKEYMYESFLEDIRTYFLEDVIISPHDIVCASIVNINKKILYKEFSDIIIDSIPKNKDICSGFFFKHYDKVIEKTPFNMSTYNKNIDPIKNQIFVDITVKNRTPTSLVINVKINDFIDNIIEEDITSEYNILFKNVSFQVKSIPFIIRIKNPEFIRVNDNASYKFKLYQPELPNAYSIDSNRLYINITNSSLIVPKEIPNGSLCIAMLSAGNILRSKTINDLYRLNNNLSFLVDVNKSEISIPERIMFVDGGRIGLIPPTKITIPTQALSADYSLISIHIKRSNLSLDFEELANERYYNLLYNKLLNVTLKPDKYIYLGFAIVNNTGSRLIQENVFHLNTQFAGKEGGTSIVNKNKVSSCNKSIEIDYLGNQPPIVQILDSITGEYIIPSNIKYTNNKIRIDVYDNEQVCYDVIIL